MIVKKIFFTLFVSALLIGGVCATSVNDFNIDKTYKNEYSSDYYSVYSKDNQSTGILIFQNVDDDVYEDKVNDDILDNVIHHDGRAYITLDDDMKIDVNSDNIINFTDLDYNTHGVCEVVKVDGQQYIIVIWAKNTSNINNTELLSQIKDFNNNNTVKPFFDI